MSTSLPPQRRVLVVLPNWLGDLVMAGPLVDLLHRSRDGSGRPLTLLGCVRRRWAPLLTRDPRFAALIPYERTGRHAGLPGIFELAASWRRAGVHAALLCPPSMRMGLAAWLARIPRRVGERSDGRGLLLSHALAPVKPRGSLHHSEEMVRLGFAFLEHLGVQPPCADGLRTSLPGLQALAAAPLGTGPPLWVLAPGAAYGPAKNWPPGRMAEFLELAVNGEGKRVALVGDTVAAAPVAELKRRTPLLDWRRELPGPAGVIDLVSATTVIDLAAILKSSQAFVGIDSGAMHLAAALSVPTLGLFGSTSAPWTGPRGGCTRVLVAEGFACQPCFRKQCNQKSFCLDALRGTDVLMAVKEMLAESAVEPPS